MNKLHHIKINNFTFLRHNLKSEKANHSVGNKYFAINISTNDSHPVHIYRFLQQRKGRHSSKERGKKDLFEQAFCEARKPNGH